MKAKEALLEAYLIQGGLCPAGPSRLRRRMSDQRRSKGQQLPKEQAKTKTKAGGVEAMTDAELDAILATAFIGLEVAQAGGSGGGGGAKKGNRAGGGGAATAPSKQDLSPAEAPPSLATAPRKSTGPLMLMDPATQCSACWGWPHKPRQCGRCELVSYCDKRCQERDWRKHKPNCLTIEEQAAKKAINEELIGQVVSGSCTLCGSCWRRGART